MGKRKSRRRRRGEVPKSIGFDVKEGRKGGSRH